MLGLPAVPHQDARQGCEDFAMTEPIKQPEALRLADELERPVGT
jgi:hypothetical protein